MSFRSAVSSLLVPAALGVNNASTPSVSLCGGGTVVSPDSSWVWSTGTGDFPSCTSPSVENVGQMCEGDPTSIVIQSNGKPQCLATSMNDCKFNMHDFQELNFDIEMVGCAGTWTSPLWMSPDHWAGGGEAGEIDMVEYCPPSDVHTNFAGGGTPKAWEFDANEWSGHVTMWKKESGDVHVSVCAGNSKCSIHGAAYYPDVHNKNGCTNGADCTYTFLSDIWNGDSGDGGWQYCAGGKVHYSSGCKYSVRNIHVTATDGTFTGKCAPLVDASPTPSPPKSPTPAPGSATATTTTMGAGWKTCAGKPGEDCCNPTLSPAQLCQDGQVCQPCGSSDSCHCPSSEWIV